MYTVTLQDGVIGDLEHWDITFTDAFFDQFCFDEDITEVESYVWNCIRCFEKIEYDHWVSDYDQVDGAAYLDNDNKTLTLYTGGEAQVIAENVYDFTDNETKDDILYLTNYSFGGYELYRYFNGKTEKIDDGVYFLIGHIV